MPSKTPRAVGEQTELFRPPLCRPSWSNLPEDVKQQVRNLLGRMLAARAMRKENATVEREENHD
jgi:hypothetical protein